MTAPLRHRGDVKYAVFSSNGQQLLTATGTDARVWNVLVKSADEGKIQEDAQLVADMAEAVSGYEVTEQGTLVRLDDQMKKLNDLRERVKEAPKGKPTAASFTRWFFSEPWERTISPTSSSTVDQYIASRLDDIQRRRNMAIEMRRDSSTRRGVAAYRARRDAAFARMEVDRDRTVLERAFPGHPSLQDQP